MKRCSKCNKLLSLSKFHKDSSSKDGLDHRCIDCKRDRRIERLYGLTPEDIETKLLEQNMRCDICSVSLVGGYHIDHCHDSNVPRGIICERCNHMLGHARDRIDILADAIKYLGKYQGICSDDR